MNLTEENVVVSNIVARLRGSTSDERKRLFRCLDTTIKTLDGPILVETLYRTAEEALSSGMVNYALEKAKSGLRLAFELKLDNLRHCLHVTLAAAHSMAGATTEALEHINLARKLSRHGTESSQQFMALIESKLMRRQGKFNRAMKLLSEALRASTTTNPMSRFDLVESYALLYSNFGYSQKAMSLAYRAIKMAENELHMKGMIRAHFLIAKVAFPAGNLATAQRHLEQARSIADRHGQIRHQGKILALMARMSMRRGKFKKAEHYLTECTELAKELGEQATFASLDLRQAELALEKSEYLPAAELALRSSRTFAALGNYSQLREARALLGEALIASGDIAGALSVLNTEPNCHAISGANGRLRLAAAQLANGELENSLESLASVESRWLPIFEHLLRLRLKEEVYRFKRNETETKEAQKCYALALKVLPKDLCGSFNLLLGRLGLSDRPVATLVTEQGRRFLTEKEIENLDIDEFSIFYDAMNSILHQRNCKEKRLPFNSIRGSLLAELMMNEKKGMTRIELYERLWKKPFNRLFNNNNVYVSMSNLRKLLHRKDDVFTIKGRYYFDHQRKNWGLLIPSLSRE